MSQHRSCNLPPNLPSWAIYASGHPYNCCPVPQLLQRDLALVMLMLGLGYKLNQGEWGHWMDNPLAWCLMLAVGLFCTRQGTHWGRFMAARCSGIRTPTRPLNNWTKICWYDYTQLNRAGFSLSLMAGIGASWATTWLFVDLLPKGSPLSHWAKAGSLWYSLSFTLLVLPILWRLVRGLSPLIAFSRHMGYRRRNRRLAILAAFLAAMALHHLGGFK